MASKVRFGERQVAEIRGYPVLTTNGHGAEPVVLSQDRRSVEVMGAPMGGGTRRIPAQWALKWMAHVEMTARILGAVGADPRHAVSLTSPTLVGDGSRVRALCMQCPSLQDPSEYDGSLSARARVSLRARFGRGPEHIGVRSLVRAVAYHLSGREIPRGGRIPRTWDRAPNREEWESQAWARIQAVVATMHDATDTRGRNAREAV